MKKLLPIFLILLLLNGCISSTVKSKVNKNSLQLDAYVYKMNNGQTTEKEDKDLIRAMRIWVWSINQALNDKTPPADVRIILESRGK